MKMKLLNFHALAEQIQAEVKEVSGRDASINTLVVAIKRFSDTMPDGGLVASKVLKDARISLSSGIVDVTIRTPRTQFPAIVKELADAASGLSEFPNIFPLSNSIKLILQGDDYALVQGELERYGQVTTQPNVARLTLNLSPRAEMTPGISSYITELLFRNGVNILDAFHYREKFKAPCQGANWKFLLRDFVPDSGPRGHEVFLVKPELIWPGQFPWLHYGCTQVNQNGLRTGAAARGSREVHRP